MMRTKWIALGTAALLLPPAAAQAQQPSPAYNWSGFYVGLNAGGAWGRAKATTTVPCNDASALVGYFCTTTNSGVSSTVADNGSGSFSGSGFTGGIQAGYNWQRGNLVYGLETDFGAFNINATRQATALYVGGPQNFTFRTSAETDWLFTVRGRFGWVSSNVLVYATGGLGVTHLDTATSFSDISVFDATGAWSASKTRLGWTIGGGLEWALGNNWTVKTEYLYFNFGSVQSSGTVTAQGTAYAQAVNTSVDLTAHIARAGVNFKF
jgi:outer membrane immunogenic protein